MNLELNNYSSDFYHLTDKNFFNLQKYDIKLTTIYLFYLRNFNNLGKNIFS